MSLVEIESCGMTWHVACGFSHRFSSNWNWDICNCIFYFNSIL